MGHLRQLTMTGVLAALPLVVGAWSNAGDPPRVWLTSELIGMNVVSENGESLGKIEDVVLHPGGETSYAVLSFGGWMGIGDKLFAMPWTMLRTIEVDDATKDSTRSLVLPLDKERLQLAPGFDKKRWPRVANASWTKDVDVFYAASAKPKSSGTVEASARTSVIAWRASDLRGANVATPTGTTLGDIKELAIDTNGRVSYAVLSVGGFLGLGDRLVAVPWDSLRFSQAGVKGDDTLITLATTKEMLEGAPEFKTGKEHRAEMCEPLMIGHVHEYFSCPPYWIADASADMHDSGN